MTQATFDFSNKTFWVEPAEKESAAVINALVKRIEQEQLQLLILEDLVVEYSHSLNGIVAFFWHVAETAEQFERCPINSKHRQVMFALLYDKVC